MAKCISLQNSHIYYFDYNNNTLYLPSLQHVIYCSGSGTELLMHSYIPFGEKCHAYVYQLAEVRGLVCSQGVENAKCPNSVLLT
jgi:hypothetical protein